MKPLKWPTKSHESQHMRDMVYQNKVRNVPAENWMAEKLESTGYRFNRQKAWGYRIFDFWCDQIGVAVEVDGPNHNRKVDGYRDRYNFHRSGIIVLRVPNFDEEAASAVLKEISRIGSSESWAQRRSRLGMHCKGHRNSLRRDWIRFSFEQRDLFGNVILDDPPMVVSKD